MEETPYARLVRWMGEAMLPDGAEESASNTVQHRTAAAAYLLPVSLALLLALIDRHGLLLQTRDDKSVNASVRDTCMACFRTG